MSNAIEGLKPELLWKYFAAISKIPRGSKNEAAITKYVLGVGRQLGLEARADKFGNVVVCKPASPGRERVHTVVLQGHLDMVCEKNKDTVHDFLKDPIVLVRQGDMLMADGTTLGADNGVAVATSLAIMEDKSLEHGFIGHSQTVRSAFTPGHLPYPHGQDIPGRASAGFLVRISELQYIGGPHLQGSHIDR